jgi:hypothetical protein
VAEPLNTDEKAEPSADDLPFESSCWVLLIPEYKRLAERLGSYQLATLDFTRAMADSVIRCMRRRVLDGGCELLPPGIWAILYLGPDLSSGTVMIFPRKISDRHVSGFVYYVWKPDIDKFWLRFELPPVPDPDRETNAAVIDSPASAASPPELCGKLGDGVSGLAPHLRRAFSSLRGLPLELKRADEVERRMAADGIVEAVDIAPDCGGRFSSAPEDGAPDEFGLQRLEERLDHGVIEAVSLSRH